MERIARFLNLEWTDSFLHHEKLIGEKIKVSEEEWSTIQIRNAIYLDSLSSWANSTWFEVGDLNQRAGMYKVFGYDMNVIHHDYLKNQLD